MSYEITALIILIFSFFGMAVILFRKIPVLIGLPAISEAIQKPLTLRVKEGVKRFPGLRSFSYELFLQKILSRIRILTLKTENKTSGWQEKLRQKSSQKNNLSSDEYWDELKKAKNGR